MIFRFFILLTLFSSFIFAENVYQLALKVAKIKEVKDIIRHERKLFAAIRRYYIDVGQWPEDSVNGDYGTLNDYTLSDTGTVISNTIYGRVLNYKINRKYKIVTIYGGQVDLDPDQLEIYRARVEAKDSDKNATYLFEKLDRRGVVGAQKKYIVLTKVPNINEATTYPVGTIGYSHYTFDNQTRYRLYIVVRMDGKNVWIPHNIYNDNNTED